MCVCERESLSGYHYSISPEEFIIQMGEFPMYMDWNHLLMDSYRNTFFSGWRLWYFCRISRHVNPWVILCRRRFRFTRSLLGMVDFCEIICILFLL